MFWYIYILCSFYDKIIYYFHNVCADSSEPPCGQFFFLETYEYQNINFNWFYGQYNNKNNSLGKSVSNQSEALLIFVTSKVVPVSAFKLYVDVLAFDMPLRKHAYSNI